MSKNLPTHSSAWEKAKRIRLVAFDLDGTLVDDTIFIWKTLHEHFGTHRTRREQAKRDFEQGRISYREWFENDLALLKARHASRDAILEVFDGLQTVPDAESTLNQLSHRGYKLALISGSLDVLLDRFFPTHPFDHVLINQLYFDKQGQIIGGQHTPYDLAGKADGLSEVARRENLQPGQCAFVGDNVNDLHVMQLAGFSVGINVKHPDLYPVTDIVLEQGLRELLSWFEKPGLDCLLPGNVP